MDDQVTNQQKQFKIKISEEMENGIYSNAISVHFTGNECILDFGYRLPSSQDPIIKIVSRVNLSHQTAESFLKVLSNAVLDWKNRQAKGPQENSEIN